jgi:DNA-binding transcriptional MerR regulator
MQRMENQKKEPSFQTLSQKSYAKVCESELSTFKTNEGGYRGVCLCLAGSEERVKEFLTPRGVGITRFAEMSGLPATTIRHYLRLGLIEPFVVNGKFKFQMVNLMQAESVRQWSELGLSLEQISARKEAQKHASLIVQDILENVTDPDRSRGTNTSVVVMRRTIEERGWLDETSITAYQDDPASFKHVSATLNELTKLSVQHLQDEYRSVAQTLEAKVQELQGRLEKARGFVKQLEAMA